ncbi:MAG: hypothetical protein JWO05_2844 [Gemmatimonadetes bacterium]|nr:hypothetical protein [Gemmatimonadota bacterium]
MAQVTREGRLSAMTNPTATAITPYQWSSR